MCVCICVRMYPCICTGRGGGEPHLEVGVDKPMVVQRKHALDQPGSLAHAKARVQLQCE